MYLILEIIKNQYLKLRYLIIALLIYSNKISNDVKNETMTLGQMTEALDRENKEKMCIRDRNNYQKKKSNKLKKK